MLARIRGSEFAICGKSIVFAIILEHGFSQKKALSVMATSFVATPHVLGHQIPGSQQL